MTAYRRLTFNQMWMAAFLVLLFLVGVYGVVSIYAKGIDKAQQDLRFRHHRGAEVVDKTIKTAFTAQELLLSLRKDLREFDAVSESVFGFDHDWPVTTSAQHPPQHIRHWLRSYPPSQEEEWLIQYSRVVDARNSLRAHWNRLEQKVLRTVSSLPEDATPDRIMEAQLLVRVSLEETIEDLASQRAVLDKVLEEYQTWKEQESA